MVWLEQNWGIVLFALYALDKLIEATPLKSNSTFQLIGSWIKAAYSKAGSPTPPQA